MTQPGKRRRGTDRASYVRAVPDEQLLVLPAGCTGKLHSADLPGESKTRPRWRNMGGPLLESYAAAMERLASWSGERSIKEGRYAVAFTGPCPQSCRNSARRCDHRTADGIVTEIVIIDPCAAPPTAAVPVFDWFTFARHRRVHQQQRYLKRIATATAPLLNGFDGKGVTALLNEAKDHLEQLRSTLLLCVRLDQQRKEVTDLLDQATGRIDAARAKYQGLVRR